MQQTPFLDITAVLSQADPAFPGAAGVNPGYDERGLLGLAFHPGFMDSDQSRIPDALYAAQRAARQAPTSLNPRSRTTTSSRTARR